MSEIDVLVVGGGGREHALAWKLRQSPRVGALLAAPGSPGMEEVAECLPVAAGNLDEIVRVAVERRIGLVVVGPEAPLAAGLVDRLREAGILAFGPTAAAARIESSKSYARDLMTRMGVPQPGYASFRDLDAAFRHLDGLERGGAEGVVVKADGLAAGKGAIVCDTFDAARASAEEMLLGGAFGEAGTEVVIEERISGEEVSLLVLTDGRELVPFLPAQDHKRAHDGDTGPNTGGMGAYAPAPVLTRALEQEALDTIVRPTLRGLEAEGAPFQGCLYAGLMKTSSGLRVIEFNCRFGDPETQAVLPLLQSDLLELLLACARGRLDGMSARWAPGAAVNVVLAGGGYPGVVENGKPIEGLEATAAVPGVTVFHAGTARRDGRLVTGGGRVLSVTGTGATFDEAIATAYAGVERIHFEGRQFRTDIAARARGSDRAGATSASGAG